MKKLFYPYSTYLGCAILNHNPYVYSVKFSRIAFQFFFVFLKALIGLSLEEI